MPAVVLLAVVSTAVVGPYPLEGVGDALRLLGEQARKTQEAEGVEVPKLLICKSHGR